MAGSKDIVYIKADRNIEVTKSDVTLGDVLQMECSNPAVVSRLSTVKLLRFHHTDQKMQNRVAVSVLKVIEKIHKEYPGITVENMGETDFIVTYEEQQTTGGMVHYLKTAAVVLISFFGAAFSTMAFNNDVDTTKMFAQIYEQLTGQVSDGFTLLELTYCIGLTIGILVFFDHFGRRKWTVDPTPMEVEMRLYENDIQTTLIETYARKEKEIDVGSKDTFNHFRT